MYVCMYVRTYVCLYACTYVFMNICMNVCTYVCMVFFGMYIFPNKNTCIQQHTEHACDFLAGSVLDARPTPAWACQNFGDRRGTRTHEDQPWLRAMIQNCQTTCTRVRSQTGWQDPVDSCCYCWVVVGQQGFCFEFFCSAPLCTSRRWPSEP
jgi:hypothetical protein